VRDRADIAKPLDDPPRTMGRISETAPMPRAAESGSERFRSDLRRCDTLEPAARGACRQEMSAARAQGLYRN
jgi:hypothetical protein